MVDVQSVRFMTDGHNIRAQFMKHLASDVISGSVGAVDNELEAAQIQLGRERALAKLDVPSRSIIYSARLPEFG